MKQNGYLITSIPYDSHLEVRIDGREVVTEKVNTAFLGCRMLSGEHWSYDHLSCTGPCRRQMDQFDRTAGMGCDDRGGEEKER